MDLEEMEIYPIISGKEKERVTTGRGGGREVGQTHHQGRVFTQFY